MVPMIQYAHLAIISFIKLAEERNWNIFMVLAYDGWCFCLIWALDDRIEADSKFFAEIDDQINIMLNWLITFLAVNSNISWIIILGFQFLERVETDGMFAFFGHCQRILGINHFSTALNGASGLRNLFYLHS